MAGPGGGEWYQMAQTHGFHGFHVFDAIPFTPFQPLWAVLPSAASTVLNSHRDGINGTFCSLLNSLQKLIFLR